MTDAELLSLPKVRVSDAARYLQNGTTPQEIRILAQNGRCPFCKAVQGKGRFAYRVHIGLLMRYKHGEMTGD